MYQVSLSAGTVVKRQGDVKRGLERAGRLP